MTFFKRLPLILSLMLLIILSALLTSCGGESYEDGIIYNGTTVVGADKNKTSLTVKDGTTVIAAGAFEGCTQLSSLTLPDTITEIMAGAFNDCDALIKVEGGVGYVDDWAVTANEGVTEISVKDGTRGIAREAFAGQGALRKVYIPTSVKYISARAFFRCSSLEEITLPFIGRGLELRNHTHFGYIFGGFNKEQNSDYVPETLNKVTITAAKTISDDAFAGCKKIATVTLPDTLKEIGDRAFANCTALSEITIPDSVESIGAKAFYECAAIVSVKLPNNEKFTTLREYTFAFCESIKELVIPESVTVIEACAIARCEQLESITFNMEMLERIGQQAFDGCKYLTELSFTSKIVGRAAFQNCTALKDVKLGEGTENIEGYAFNGCAMVESFSIPTTVKRIGEYSFYACYSVTSFTIPSGVEAIKKSAFGACSRLSELVIPESVKTIATDAFTGCSSLVERKDGASYVNGWITEIQPTVTSLLISCDVIGFANGAFDDAINLAEIVFDGTENDFERLKSAIPSRILSRVAVKFTV